MIIWINGAFGSGKTSAAYELDRRLTKSYVYDPEEAGFFIRDNIPPEIKQDDFQNYPMWREFNYKILKYIHSKYDGIIIVPMTITDENYFKEIIGKLRKDNIELKHFVLMANKDTLLGRLKKRGEGGKSWAAKQIDRCLVNLTKEVFQEHIDTDNMTIRQVIEHIANQCGFELLPDNRNWLQVKRDRIVVWLRHIRLLKG